MPCAFALWNLLPFLWSILAAVGTLAFLALLAWAVEQAWPPTPPPPCPECVGKLLPTGSSRPCRGCTGEIYECQNCGRAYLRPDNLKPYLLPAEPHASL
jgi:hypothetical protein